MKRALILLFLAAIATVLFYPTSNPDTSEALSPTQSEEAEKLFPEERFALMRSWPDAAFDMKAYTGAIREAREQMLSRGPGGFPGAWQVEGPGNIGARINTIAIHPTDPSTIYAGFARGGLWKTTDMGNSWIPVFDDQPFLAIGDIALDPNDPETVYVGTGDPNISGYPGIGDGVWKSTDGGQSWQHMGLEATRIVSQIRIDPTNSDVVYVATMGIPFEPNQARGLYKSVDGGQNWEQILFISEDSGICDLLMDWQDPQTLYAAGWNRIRNNFESTITGPASRIFKTTDGGANWTELGGGLPQDDLGRIGLAMSGTDPNILFAEYVGTNSQLFGIYRSNDGGQSWVEIPTNPATGLDESALGGFGWYFAKLRVHPDNNDMLFLLGIDLWRTNDGGQNWTLASPPWWSYEVHADKHDLIFGPPGAPYDFLLATDGGLYANYGGQNYEDIENIPTNQFYRIAVNPFQSENYYGGMQDNGSSGGNSSILNNWPRICGGDGFQMAFHPDNPSIFFCETQNGRINATFDGGFNFNFVSGPLANDDRKNWDMPYQLSAHDPNVVYSGTYKAWRGEIVAPAFDVVWDSISGDLTKGVLTEPTFHTISTLHESPVVPGLLYVGTTDGNLSRTENGGLSWDLVSATLPDRYVTDVKASPTFSDNVYVVHSGYKWGEYIPHIHRSTDRGTTWEDISGDLPDLAINDVYILPTHNDSVLFVGTDGGVYGTLDAGTTWHRVGEGMPMVPVYDLEINPDQQTLVAGTFARSIMTWPLDSITFPTPEDTMVTSVQFPVIAKEELQVYPNPTTGTLWLDAGPEVGDWRVQILQADGRLVRETRESANASGKIRLDVGSLPSGTYFLKVSGDSGIRSGRFVVQR